MVWSPPHQDRWGLEAPGLRRRDGGGRRWPKSVSAAGARAEARAIGGRLRSGGGALVHWFPAEVFFGPETKL